MKNLKIKNILNKLNFWPIIIVLFFIILSLTLKDHLPFKIDSNELDVIINTLKFGATKSFKPTEHLTYGTLYLYVLLFFYGIYFVIGNILGFFKDQYEFAIQFFKDPTYFFLIGRYISVFFGSLITYLIFVESNKEKNFFIAISSSLFLLTYPAFWARCHYALPDVMAAFFSLLTIYYSFKIIINPTIKNYLVAGSLLGLAFAAKQNTGIFVIAIILAHYFSCRSGERANLKFLFDKSLLLSGLSCILTIFIANPYFFLDFSQSIGALLFERSQVNTIVKGVGVDYLWIPVQLLKQNYFVATIWFLGTLTSLFTTRKPRDYIIAAIICLYILSIGSWKSKSLHYILPIIPLLALQGSNFLEDLYKKLHSGLIRRIFIYMILAILIISSLNIYTFTRQRRKVPPVMKAQLWIMNNLSFNEKIAFDSYEDFPQVFTLDRYFSNSRSENYQNYLPSSVKTKLINYARNNGSYNTIRIRYYHDKPLWPITFSKDKVIKMSKDKAIVRLYRMDYYTIEELGALDVKYLVLSKNMDYFKERQYNRNDIGYHPHKRMKEFYQQIEKSKKIKLIKQFSGNKGRVRIYELTKNAKGMNTYTNRPNQEMVLN